MHLPNQSEPAVRRTHRGAWRDAGQVGLLEQNGEGEYEFSDSDESEETANSESSGEY